jgi:hypothetical protein
MEEDNVANLLEDIAPVLVAALTGNEIGAAVAAAKSIADIFGWQDKSVDHVTAEVKTIPELTTAQKIQLATLNDNFIEAQTKVQLGDTEDARTYVKRHAVADVIASIITLMWGMSYFLPEYLHLTDSSLNFLYTAMGAVIVYYMGAGQLPLANIARFLNEKQET